MQWILVRWLHQFAWWHQTYKEHHALSLKNFENILRLQAFCGQPGHEKKELEFFCKSCEAAVCYSCIATLHEDHPKILLDKAANERKLHVRAAIESKREITLQKRENITRIQGNCVNILGQIDSVKKDAQKFVDSMFAALEATKQEIFNDVEKKANETLQHVTLKISAILFSLKMKCWWTELTLEELEHSEVF